MLAMRQEAVDVKDSDVRCVGAMWGNLSCGHGTPPEQVRGKLRPYKGGHGVPQ